MSERSWLTVPTNGDEADVSGRRGMGRVRIRRATRSIGWLVYTTRYRRAAYPIDTVIHAGARHSVSATRHSLGNGAPKAFVVRASRKNWAAREIAWSGEYAGRARVCAGWHGLAPTEPRPEPLQCPSPPTTAPPSFIPALAHLPFLLACVRIECTCLPCNRQPVVVGRHPPRWNEHY